MSPPSIDIVMPVHKDLAITSLAIRAVLNQLAANDRILVCLDRKHLEPSWMHTWKDHPSVLVLPSGPNIGAAAARNRGLARANREIVLFLDSDCCPDPGWLDSHRQCHATSGQPVIAAGRILFTGTSRIQDLAITNCVFINTGYLLKVRDEDGNPAWGVTGNLSVPLTLAKEVPFAEDFPTLGGGEDIYFCRNILARHDTRVTEVSGIVRQPVWPNLRDVIGRLFRWGKAETFVLHRSGFRKPRRRQWLLLHHCPHNTNGLPRLYDMLFHIAYYAGITWGAIRQRDPALFLFEDTYYG